MDLGPMSAAAPALVVDHVTKHFGSLVALDDVTFTVERGEVFGYVGPNGSGKTTTIRALLDLLRPDAGQVTVLGMDPRRSGAAERRRIGYLPGELTLWPRMTGVQVLTELARVRSLDDLGRAHGLAERFRLDLSRHLDELSKGNRQKLGLIQAFMHDPELVILDEPSSGLDPLMQRELQELVREYAVAGGTVFVSSHVMTEIERMAHRVAVIHDGVLRAVDEIADLELLQPQRLHATFSTPVQLVDVDLPEGVIVDARSNDGTTATFLVPDPDRLPAALRVLSELGTVSLDAGHGSLEEILLAMLAADDGDGS